MVREMRYLPLFCVQVMVECEAQAATPLAFG
jgi:hypothetical protein